MAHLSPLSASSYLSFIHTTQHSWLARLSHFLCLFFAMPPLTLFLLLNTHSLSSVLFPVPPLFPPCCTCPAVSMPHWVVGGNRQAGRWQAAGRPPSPLPPPALPPRHLPTLYTSLLFLSRRTDRDRDGWMVVDSGWVGQEGQTGRQTAWQAWWHFSPLCCVLNSSCP